MPCPEKFRESLLRFQVPQEMIQRANEGYEDLVSSLPSNAERIEKTPRFRGWACPGWRRTAPLC